MPEHRIRLRAGWESSAVGDDLVTGGRLILPVVFEPGSKGLIRLTRRFGRPLIDPRVESAHLELRKVPGLRGLWLNRTDLGPIPLDVVDWTLPLGPLEPRNTLILEVDPPEGMAGAWGSIALVIGPGPDKRG